MLILATDTSTPYLSIALCDDNKVIAEVSTLADRKHSEKLLMYVDQILKETGTELTDIDLLAVAHGPGSFTGIRVGVSAWKGLASGANIPITGISTLDALAARTHTKDGTVCVLLDAKMGEVYSSIYSFDNGTRTILQSHAVSPIEDVLQNCPTDTLFLGDGATLCREQIRSIFPDAQILSEAYDFPGAVAVALEALKQSSREATPDNVIPIYLRKSQAEIVRDEKEREAAS